MFVRKRLPWKADAGFSSSWRFCSTSVRLDFPVQQKTFTIAVGSALVLRSKKKRNLNERYQLFSTDLVQFGKTLRASYQL